MANQGTSRSPRRLVPLLAAGLLGAASAQAQLGQTAGQDLFSTQVSADATLRVEDSEGLVDGLFEFHVLRPTTTVEAAQEEMRAATLRFVELVTEMLGGLQVQARLQDLAANSPLAPGKIPLYWIDGVHPHNINVGTPYTGLAIAPKPMGPPGGPEAAAGVVVHELAHLFFGKFNDGLAEPIANMFQPRFFQGGVRLAEARLLLRESREGALKGSFDLETMLSYRPTSTRRLCSAYAQAQQTDPATAREVAGGFAEYETLGSLASLLEDEGVEVPEETRAVLAAAVEPSVGSDAADLLNPNETRGPVREVFATLGDVLQHFLIANFGVKAYLDFYYTPKAETLAAMGIEGGFPGLEAALAAWIDGELAGTPQFLDEAQVQRGLEQHLDRSRRPGSSLAVMDCLHPDNWESPDCDTSRGPPPGPGGAASGPGQGASQVPGQPQGGGFGQGSGQASNSPFGQGYGQASNAAFGQGSSAASGPGAPQAPGAIGSATTGLFDTNSPGAGMGGAATASTSAGPGQPAGAQAPPPGQGPPQTWQEQLERLRAPRKADETLPVAASVVAQLGAGMDLDRFCSPDRVSKPQPQRPRTPRRPQS